MIGSKGDPKDVTRVIEVKMYDNYYEPSSIKVKKGETVKIIVKNLGELVHEYNIATKEMHIKHQPEMARLIEHDILLGDSIDHAKMKEMSKKDKLKDLELMIEHFVQEERYEDCALLVKIKDKIKKHYNKQKIKSYE